MDNILQDRRIPTLMDQGEGKRGYDRRGVNSLVSGFTPSKFQTDFEALKNNSGLWQMHNYT